MLILVTYTLWLLIRSTEPLESQGALEPYAIDLQNDPAHVLELLPRIGVSRANDIVTFRETQSIQSPQDLLAIKGIGQKTIDDLQGLTKSGARKE
jgi:DNA uptake protein ComE-like DNA-binding protein